MFWPSSAHFFCSDFCPTKLSQGIIVKMYGVDDAHYKLHGPPFSSRNCTHQMPPSLAANSSENQLMHNETTGTGGGEREGVDRGCRHASYV